jgi:hypothetical protein
VLISFKCGLASKVGLRHLSWNNSDGSATGFNSSTTNASTWKPDDNGDRARDRKR